MQVKHHLVCEHLENISRDALDKYQHIIRQYVRRRQGVYALYRKNRLYYVGLASNLKNRLAHHLKDRHAESWDRFSVYLTIGDKHLKELESLILRIVKPSGNKVRGTFPRADDLRRTFSRDIRRSQEAERQAIFGKAQPRPIKKREDYEKEGRNPVLALYRNRPREMRGHFKGRLVHARVLRDGRVSYAGRIFTSPSLAAAAACNRKTCNGWTFWNYERAKGDWIPLDELRN